VGEACGTHGRRNCIRFWRESPKEIDHSEDRGVYGRMEIRIDIREIVFGGGG
jgi:hypothetical protein